MSDKLKQAEAQAAAVEAEKQWVIAYLASYAILFFNDPSRHPTDIDLAAERHADFLTAKVEEREAKFARRKKP